MKMPPPEKIYEAWSAIASGRLASQSDPNAQSGSATILSSGRNKEYRVAWDGKLLYSTDPASWWQAYPGYPALAVLMYRKWLPYDGEIARKFANVPWEEINKAAKKDYAKGLEMAFARLELDAGEIARARAAAEKTFADLAGLQIEIRRLTKKSGANE